MKTKDITVTALMAALVFAGTYFFKIPVPFGYTHLGDGMILLTVLLFGYKKGAAAGMIGAGLADLLGGYTAWVLPTMLIKGSWALILGAFLILGSRKSLPYSRLMPFLGAVLGGIFHIAAYSLVKIPLYGIEATLVELPFLTVQTICGIIIAGVLAAVIYKSGAYKRLQTV